MDRANGGVAVADGFHQDSDSHQVENLVKVAAADDHLLVDRPVVLRPAHDLGVDAGVLHRGLDFILDAGDVLVALGGSVRDDADDLLVLARIQDRKGEVLQLPFDGRHPQPVRQWCDDLQRFASLLRLLLRRQEAHGPHVVQPVADLDDQHAGVVRHRHDHLSDGLGLRCGTERHLVQLGDTVHEARNLLAEISGELLE